MRATICQLPDDPDSLSTAWRGLVAHVRAANTDLVLLPEMPFAPWPMGSQEVDTATWSGAVSAHEGWIARLEELDAPAVAGTRPTGTGEDRRNVAFVWTREGITDAHTKYYLPDEPGFWEETWYRRGDGSFEPIPVGNTRAGFLICTEMWFSDRARRYARDGVDVLLIPRATPDDGADKWLAGGRAAAVTSGAYALSSNRSGPGWAGLGWVIHPDGEVMAITSGARPWVTVNLDPEVSRRAKTTYPRYVSE